VVNLAYLHSLRSSRRRVRRRAIRHESPFSPSGAAQSRSFGDRLRQFMGESGAAPGDRPVGESRMQFFMAFVPLRRHGPKPAAYLREILARIHRVLRGN
jgi:hypothetical protein